MPGIFLHPGFLQCTVTMLGHEQSLERQAFRYYEQLHEFVSKPAQVSLYSLPGTLDSKTSSLLSQIERTSIRTI